MSTSQDYSLPCGVVGEIPVAAVATGEATARRARAVGLFALAVFWSAFLLFQVQPLIGKYILPWFGGTPGVWTTCMLFFQLLLLGGYAYAHFTTSHLTPRRQAILHGVLLLASLAFLPIIPSPGWKPHGMLADPTGKILVLLLVCLGLPYFVLSATGPLLQAWFAKLNPGVSPYRLYALSNVGSLLALVSYPFVFEPLLSRPAQAKWWSAGLAVFALICGGCVWLVGKYVGDVGGTAEERRLAATANQDAGHAPGVGDRIMWFLLPACATTLLLAVTNKICQDVAVIPFLWVLPLSLYLLTFILAFDHPRWYLRSVFVPLLLVGLYVALCLMFAEGGDTDKVTLFDWHVLDWTSWKHWPEGIATTLRKLPHWRWEVATTITVQVMIYAGVMFTCCMVCHGELARMRPHPKYLTGYFLEIAAGGAAGGIFVAVLAPRLFQAGFFELQIGLWACAALVLARLALDRTSGLYLLRGSPVVNALWVLLVAGSLVYGMFLKYAVNTTIRESKVVTASRNFYGTLKVFDENPKEPDREAYVLYHGAITHGLQYQAEGKRQKPTSYYGPTSGAGKIWQYFPRHENRRMAVVGLGSGSMAAWAQKGDWLTFYEINPDILKLAQDPFTYLADARKRGATVDVRMGDGRLTLENEPTQGYDAMFLDAFSGDAIPVHLLTKECFDTYVRHLKGDGVIAVHISNRHLDLQPVVLKLAEHFGLSYAIISDDPSGAALDDEDGESDPWLYESDYVLLSKNKDFLNTGPVKSASSPANEKKRQGLGLWTDDSTNLFQILRAKG